MAPRSAFSRLCLMIFLMGALVRPALAEAKAAGTAADMAAPTLPTAQAPLSDTSPVLAQALAEKLGASLSYDPLTGYGMMEKGGSRLSFALGLPEAVLDWTKTIAIEAPVQGEKGLSFSSASAASLGHAFGFVSPGAPSHFSVAAILIDPGHGGKDPGAIGEHVIDGKSIRVVEKEVTLSIAKKVFELLKTRFPDKKILITREGDSYPTLEDRVDMANAVQLAPEQAIIYVSIHANSSFNKNARGFEVWYLNPEYRRTLVDSRKPGGPKEEIAPILNAMMEEEFTTESIILARNLVAGLQGQIGSETQNRGIRAEEWFVVRNARMPSVLIESGFVTNPEEGKLLTQDDYLARVAHGVYNGLVDFVDYFESMRGAPSP